MMFLHELSKGDKNERKRTFGGSETLQDRKEMHTYKKCDFFVSFEH